MRRQAVWVGAPVHFHLAREVRDRVRFHPHCGNAQLLAFHEHGARPAEWIKDPLLRSDVELVEILTYEMGRKREHEAIPFVDRAILRVELVELAVRVALASRGIAHSGVSGLSQRPNGALGGGR